MSGDYCEKHEINHAGDVVCWKCALEWKADLEAMRQGVAEMVKAGLDIDDPATRPGWTGKVFSEDGTKLFDLAVDDLDYERRQVAEYKTRYAQAMEEVRKEEVKVEALIRATGEATFSAAVATSSRLKERLEAEVRDRTYQWEKRQAAEVALEKATTALRQLIEAAQAVIAAAEKKP